MSSNSLAPRSRSEASPRLQLAAHTEAANVLAEQRSLGKISQKDYDAQTYSTTILSWDRVTSVPIILTLDDSLATLIAYAHRAFQIPLVNAETTKMYVLWSTKIFHAVGVHRVPENLALLDQDRLNMILTFMKASPQVEQFFVQFEKDASEIPAKLEGVAVKVEKGAAEDDIPALKEEDGNLNARGSGKGKERSTAGQVKDEGRSSGDDSNTQDSMVGHQQTMDLHGEERKHRVSRARGKDVKREHRVSRGGRILSASTSGASKESSKGYLEEEKRGNRRGGN